VGPFSALFTPKLGHFSTLLSTGWMTDAVELVVVTGHDDRLAP
jgi:hypothetical protein